LASSSARHLDVEVERADLVAQLDDVGAHGVVHLLELLRLLALPPAAAREQQPPPPTARTPRRSAPRRLPPPPPFAAASSPALISPMRSVKSSRIALRPSLLCAFSAASAPSAVAPSGATPAVLPARSERPATST
jgi:hypothetical protein